MLKLLKYEWKACARICLPLYGLVILIALVNGLQMRSGFSDFLHGIPTILTSMLYFGVMVAVFVVTAVILIQRFYKNLLGSEGYLMFALPVSVSQHIFAKMLVAVVMSVLSCVAAVISVLLLAGVKDAFRVVIDFVPGIAKMDGGAVLILLEILLWFVLAAAAGALFVYLCIALGHLAKKHRILMAIVWYFVLTTVIQFLLSLVLLAGGNGLPPTVVMAMRNFFSGMSGTGIASFVLLIACGMTAIGGAICFLGTRFILKNKLNLE